jgi:hypothetical protein
LIEVQLNGFNLWMFNCVNDEYGRVTTEDVKTGGWGVQIRSSKDIFQFDDEPLHICSI